MHTICTQIHLRPAATKTEHNSETTAGTDPANQGRLTAEAAKMQLNSSCWEDNTATSKEDEMGTAVQEAAIGFDCETGAT